MANKQQSKKGSRKIGRSKRRGNTMRYQLSGRRETRKIKHMLHSNGVPFARAWATRHNQLARFHKMAG